MQHPIHPSITRRTAIQAGAIGLLGLGTNHLTSLREVAARESSPPAASPHASAKSCLYIFLSGGLSQPKLLRP